MKRQTAIKYAREVGNRLHLVNGILSTPNCDYEAYIVRRVWVFGSTAKGAAEPNDLDLLIDARSAGRRIIWKRGRKLDKGYLRSYRARDMPRSKTAFLKWLTRGMRRVSRHLAAVEEIPIDVKLLIYPRWDLPDVTDLTAGAASPAIASVRACRSGATR
jgi:hypothetical protein